MTPILPYTNANARRMVRRKSVTNTNNYFVIIILTLFSSLLLFVRTLRSPIERSYEYPILANNLKMKNGDKKKCCIFKTLNPC